MMNELRRPRARHDDLVVTFVGEDLLVYDARDSLLHHLNRVTSAVWLSCDGLRMVDEVRCACELALGMPVSAAAIDTALVQLVEAELLESSSPALEVRTGVSRRRLLRRVGVAGAVAVPVLVSVSVPAVAHHESDRCHGPDEGCVIGQDCCQDPLWGARFCVTGTCQFTPPPV